MLRNTIVVILLVVVARSHAKDQLVYNLAEKIVDNMVTWPLEAHHADLDNTTLEKASHLTHRLFAHPTTLGRPFLPNRLLHLFALTGRARQVHNHVLSEPKELLSEPKQVQREDTTNLEAQQKLVFNFGEVGRLWMGQSEIPVAELSLSEWGDLLKSSDGVLFVIVKQLMEMFGDAFLLPIGMTSSFLVLSDPASAQHVLEGSYSTYDKGMARELTLALFGDGLLVTNPGEPWKIRRRALTPSLHRKYIDTMVRKVFANCTFRAAEVLTERPGQAIDMEEIFRQLTLDIIGKAVFNHDFNLVGQDKGNPLAEAINTALNEADLRSRDVVPIWKLPVKLACLISPRQKHVADAIGLVQKTTKELIENCRLQLEAEEAAGVAGEFKEEYVSEADPSVLRFLIASREEVKSDELRDDMLSMLIAGHETTASTLAWALYLLVKHPDEMATVQKEIDAALGAKIEAGNLTVADLRSVNSLRWCIAEAMRLYPQPPVHLRRAMKDDVLPSGLKVPKGQDVMIPIYSIHRSAKVWSDPDEFQPQRWSGYTKPSENPNEKNTNYRYIPFGGGPRKCIGDQFALTESYVIFAVLLYKFDFKLVSDQKIRMKMAGTIHAADGMMMTYTPRKRGA